MVSRRYQVLIMAFLCGCATTTSSTVAKTEPPPQEPIVPFLVGGQAQTVQVPPGTGLFIEGRSSYDMERQLQQFSQREPESARQTELYAFFGTLDTGFIRQQAMEIHQYILPLLTKKIEQSPLKYEKWNGEYRLSFNVLDLDFWRDQASTTDWRPGTAVAQISITLLHVPDNKALLVQQPHLMVRFNKEVPGGKQTLNGLYEESAQQIFAILSGYWSTVGKKS